MLYNVIYITIFISILITNSYSKPVKQSKNESERCCWAKQFSADVSLSTNIRLSDGTIEEIHGTYSLSYDADRHLTGMKGGSITMPSGEESFLWIIQSIIDKKIYTIDEISRTCTTSPLPFMPVECIPEEAIYMSSSTLQYDNKTIITDTWLVESKGVSTYSTVSRDGLCIPLNGQVIAPNLGMNSSQTITHFVPKIEDQSIIDIPKQCLYGA